MPKLRPHEQQNVIRHLDATPFGRFSFDVRFPDSTLVVIQFTADASFQFTISEVGGFGSLVAMASNSRPPATQLAVQMSPGKYAVEESIRCGTFSEALQEIRPWAVRIEEDLHANLVDVQDLKEFHEEFREFLGDAETEEDKRFSPDEVERVSTKLSELEERLKGLEQQHQITKQQLEDLLESISRAQADLQTLPKSTWYRTAGARLWGTVRAAAKTPEVRQFLLEIARKAISGN